MLAMKKELSKKYILCGLLFITTEALVTDIEKEAATPATNPGMMGM
jgi:hypothetical protein